MEIPKWAQHLADRPDLKADFRKWLDARKQDYALHAVTQAASMDQVLGVRYAIGELDAMWSMVIALETEEAERKRQYGEME